MTRIYFNRWFSAIYNYMELIRNNRDNQRFSIFATHVDPYHMALQGADFSALEPSLQGEDYAQFCLDFCKKNEIECFIPNHNMLDLAKNYQLFESSGIKMTVHHDYHLLQQISMKDSLFEMVSKHSFVTVPEYYVVNNHLEFKEACTILLEKGKKICFKPTSSDGGRGFRIIQENRDKFADLYGYVTPYISVDETVEILKNNQLHDKIMVMEFILGDEYTIDCLSDMKGNLLVAIPRRKGTRRTRYLVEDQRLIEIAHKFAQLYKLPYNFNIQVIIQDDVINLIEINPRMSGGLAISCLSGVNLPYLAIRLALGEEIEIPKPQFDMAASSIETEFILKKV
jgi:biotin carboxylase